MENRMNLPALLVFFGVSGLMPGSASSPTVRTAALLSAEPAAFVMMQLRMLLRRLARLRKMRFVRRLARLQRMRFVKLRKRSRKSKETHFGL